MSVLYGGNLQLCPTYYVNKLDYGEFKMKTLAAMPIIRFILTGIFKGPHTNYGFCQGRITDALMLNTFADTVEPR